jgi:putative oxidoreductase
MQKIAVFIGRSCIGLLFIVSAVYKFFDWKGMEKAFIKSLCDWHGYSAGAESLQDCFSDILPWVPAILIVAVTCELLGGLSVLVNLWPRAGATVLLLFLIPTTIIFHQFWFLEGVRRELQLVLFLKNVAIMGGLFYVLAFGGKGPSKKRAEAMNLPEIDKE